MNTKNKKINNKTEGVIAGLVNLAGISAGIIILAIGSIMFLENIFKYYIFNIKNDYYGNSDWVCEKYNIEKAEIDKLLETKVGNITPIAGGPLKLSQAEINMVTFGPDFDNLNSKQFQKQQKKQDLQLTAEEKEKIKNYYQKCIEKTKKEDTERFANQVRRNIATALAFIFVGLPLIIFYQRRRKNNQ